LELFEALEGTLAGAADALHAPLELGEGFAPAGGGLTEGILVIGTEGLQVVKCPELGFGGAEAAFEPLPVDEVVEEGAGFRGSGMVALVVLVDELLEVGELFGGEDERFGVDAGFEGVHGGGGLACDRGGAGRFLGVTTIGFYLTESGHGWLAGPDWTGKDACPTLRIQGAISGIRGREYGSHWE
jgi:hypothetical protein